MIAYGEIRPQTSHDVEHLDTDQRRRRHPLAAGLGESLLVQRQSRVRALLQQRLVERLTIET